MNEPKPASPLSTPNELAALLKVSVKTIYYWVSRNEIPFIRIGKHLRFHADDVLRSFVDKTEEATACRGSLRLVTSPGQARSLKIGPGHLAYNPKKE